MKKYNIKHGFTLVELMVFFLFITLLLAAATPVITRKVRDLPTRARHGMYVCTNDDSNNQIEIYYSAYGRAISRNNVDRCNFHPPYKANFYRVQLVGGGAGGWSTTDQLAINDEPVNERLSYSLPQNGITMRNDRIIPIKESGMTPQQIKYALNGRSFALVRETPDGIDGEDVSMEYSDLLKCTIVPQDHSEDANSWIKILRRDMTTANACNGKKLNPQCQMTGYGHWRDYFDIEANTKKLKLTKIPISTITGKGGTGGKGNNIVLQGTFDFRLNSGRTAQTDEEIEEYLESLFTERLQFGTTTESGNCKTWNKKAISQGPPKLATRWAERLGVEEKEFTNDNNLIVEFGKDKNLQHNLYEAIKYNDGQQDYCITNDNIAQNGLPGYVRLNLNDGYIGASEEDTGKGEDAKRPQNLAYHGYGIIYLPKDIPMTTKINDAELEANLLNRLHMVGYDGNAGEYKYFDLPSWPNNCTMIAGKAGKHITTLSAQGKLDVEHILQNVKNKNNKEQLIERTTFFACEDGGINYSALGGEYIPKMFEKEYHTVEYINPNKAYWVTPRGPNYNKELYNNPEFFETKASDDDEDYHNICQRESKYPKNKFTNFEYIPYGQGGEGNIIKDYCTWPRGGYWFFPQTDRNTPPNPVNMEHLNCNQADIYDNTQATNGTSGAIIITW